MRRAALLAIALLIAGALWFPWQRAEAHATLVRAEPAENAFLKRAPTEIILTFSETLDANGSRIVLVDATGHPITDGGVVVGDGLRLRLEIQLPGPGIYNVLWENLSTVDGHALRGSYPFTVLNPDGSLPEGTNQVATSGSDPDPAPEAESVAVRSIGLLGLVIVASAALLAVCAAPLSPRRLLLIAGAGVAVLAIATAFQIVVLADTGDGRGLGSLLSSTRLGQWWMVRAGAVVTVAALLPLVARRRAWAGATLAVLGVYLAGFTATSHAAAGTGAGWAVIADYFHGVAAVGWIGGVVGLALSARLSGSDTAYRRIMPRFGRFASLSVFVLIGTGLLNSLVLLGAFDDLWTTRYGIALTAKLALMLPLLGVALYNARRGRTLLERTKSDGTRQFIRLALAEALLGGLVLFAGALLTQSTVAKNVFERPDDRPFDETTSVADLVVRFEVDPNRTGLNTYTVTLTDAAGEMVDASRVRLTFRYQDDQTLGASVLALGRTPEGTFLGAGPYLTLEGDWRIEVEVRRDNVDDQKAFFAVRPAGAAVGIASIGGAWDNPAAALSWNEYAGFAALIVGVGAVLFKPRLPRRKTVLSWTANGVTVLLFGFGFLLLFGVHGHQPVAGLPQNPVFPDADSIERGRTIYQQNCVTCHGTAGVPPRGLDLDPYPLDLTVHVPQHADGQIFRFVQDGLPGTAMRAWGEGDGAFSDEQIWHIVNFLRTLAQSDR